MHTWKWQHRWLAMAALLFLAACAANIPAYSPTPWWTIKEANFASLKPGVTTKAEVRQLIGAPLLEINFPRKNEEAWEYRYLQGTTTIMLAYVHFGPNGIYKYSFHELDPAFHGAGLM